MDLLLSLELGHAVASIVWLAGGAVLALILLAAGRDDAAALRAVAEAELIGRRVLRPAAVLTILSGLALVALAGLALEAWVWLSTALLLGALAARHLLVAPALAAARSRQDPAEAHRALALVLRDLSAQVGVLALMVAKPGWTGAAILLGLGTCLALAVALLRSLGEAEAQAA
jgi:hypothetical protein